jgi:hypothetical protein
MYIACPLTFTFGRWALNSSPFFCWFHPLVDGSCQWVLVGFAAEAAGVPLFIRGGDFSVRTNFVFAASTKDFIVVPAASNTEDAKEKWSEEDVGLDAAEPLVSAAEAKVKDRETGARKIEDSVTEVKHQVGKSNANVVLRMWWTDRVEQDLQDAKQDVDYAK